MQLFINNKEVKICKVELPDRFGFCSVYVNGYASCHSIPENLLKNGGKCRTSGNTYQVKI